ncbi:MAG: hypothetical protein AB7G35_23925 [Hyphomicrobiaceae bacterium]
MISRTKLFCMLVIASASEAIARRTGDADREMLARANRLRAKFCLSYPHNERDADVAVRRLLASSEQ